MVSNINQFANWNYEIDDENIIWLAFDRMEQSVNSLSQESIAELRQIVKLVHTNKISECNNIKGMVIYSAKKTGFIAGADVKEFKSIKTAESARSILENGQQAMNEVADLRIPTVAMIDGFCFGGGFELALACDYRVAADNTSTKLGLPEVMLGIIPGWGGTVRLARLIGGNNALPLIMQGRALHAKSALKKGMIDACVPVRQLKRAVIFYINNRPKKYKPGWFTSLLNHQPFRNVFNYFAVKELKKKARQEHYPAPFAALENWRKNGVEGKKAFTAEIDADLKLIEHPTAKNLMRIFFLQEQLKEQSKQNDFKAKHVHVIGGGTMGGDIAAWCAFKGLTVTLQDRNYEALSPALKRAYSLFVKKLKKEDLAQLTLDKITPDIEGHGIKSADVIIEAVFENLEVKQQLFKAIEQNAKKEAIIATNTSSIPLDQINEALTDKTRLVGIHFFNPVAKMMLIEVVKGKLTDEVTAQKASAFVNQIGKLAVPVSSSPGFLVNRVLSSYMHETFILLQEGVVPEQIDIAMKKFGMPMGPVEMADIVGLDICLSVAKNIAQFYQEDVPDILSKMVENKHLGKKTNKGFYNYQKGKIVRNKVSASNKQDKIIERLTMRVINTCMACLREGVIASSDLVDAGLIFGAGFAPFRGGPMNYSNTLGHDKVIEIMKRLESEFGVRFKVDEGFESKKKQEVNEHAQLCG